MKKDVKQIIERLLDLQEKYSFAKRHLVTGDRYEQIIKTGLVEDGDYSNLAVREPLMEHVGHLPVLASFLHPYIEHGAEVDLGKVLVMLAIHDIGETEVGDVFYYDKTAAEKNNEVEVALSLLVPEQKAVFAEYQQRDTLESKYAKSIDALTPIVHSMERPLVKIENFKMKGRVVKDVVDYYRQYFEWDSFLLELFDMCLEHYLEIEKGEEGIFTVKG